MFSSNDKLQEFKNILSKQNENSGANLVGTTYTVIPTEIEITPVRNKYKIILTIVLAMVCLCIGINILSSINNSNPKVFVDYNENVEEKIATKKNVDLEYSYKEYAFDSDLTGKLNIKKKFILS